MINVRLGVFETNSSSSHSIIVRKPQSSVDDLNNNRYTYSSYGHFNERNGTLMISSDCEFGWGFSILASWIDRFVYALAEFKHKDDMIDKIVDMVKEMKPEVKEVDFGFRDEISAYIDHQSQGMLRGFLNEEEIDLKEFIFNDKYVLIIDNDNNCKLNRLIDYNLLNRRAIKTIYPDDIYEERNRLEQEQYERECEQERAAEDAELYDRAQMDEYDRIFMEEENTYAEN